MGNEETYVLNSQMTHVSGELMIDTSYAMSLK